MVGGGQSVGKGAVQGVMVKFIRMDEQGEEPPAGARISKGPVGPLKF